MPDFKRRVRSLLRSLTVRSFSSPQSMLPTHRHRVRREGAGMASTRVRRHQWHVERLRSSRCGPGACCWTQFSRRGQRTGQLYDHILAHSVSVQRAAPWLRHSSGWWLFVEYGSWSLAGIDTVPGHGSGATETGLLCASESRSGRVCEIWALSQPQPDPVGSYCST